MKSSDVQGLVLAIQFALGFMFLWSTIPKISNLKIFAGYIRDYRLIPPIISLPMALIMAGLQLLIATSLLSGFYPILALSTAIILLATYLFAVTVNLIRGRDIACGCFGDAQESIGGTTILRLALSMSATVALIAIYQYQIVTPTGLASATDVAAAKVAVVQVIASLLLVAIAMWVGEIRSVFWLFHPTDARQGG